jgi:hypothetical protein
MRIRTSLCLLAGCCAALAACTAAAPKGPNTTVRTPSVGRPPPPASAQAALASEAFSPYAALGYASNDGLAPGESTFTFGAACMTAAGYPSAGYFSITGTVNIGAANGLWYVQPSSPWGGWGYLGAADAQQYGFQFSPAALQSAVGIGYQAPGTAPSLSRGEQAAAGKCYTIFYDFANAVGADCGAPCSGPLTGIVTLANDISTDVQNDPAVKAATRAWSACMAKNGYSFGQPEAAGDQEGQALPWLGSGRPVSATAQRAQLAAAVTDAGCTQSSDLAGIYFAVQASYEQELVTANQQALAAAVSAYRTIYRKDLAKLSALLRTAKAQPFSTSTHAPRASA